MESKTKKEETKEEVKEKSKSDKQLYWVLGIMAGLIMIFLVSSSLFKDAGSFEYQGLKFTKEKFNTLDLFRYSYQTEGFGKTITGQIVSTGKPQAVNILLRKDPRQNNVPVTGTIEYLPKEKFIYVSFANGSFCEYSQVAVANLGTFLGQNGFTVKPASADKIDAETNNLTYVDCENRPDNMVLLLQGGEESSIVRENNCYTITIANCDILSATEKFIVQSIIDAKTDEAV